MPPQEESVPGWWLSLCGAGWRWLSSGCAQHGVWQWADDAVKASDKSLLAWNFQEAGEASYLKQQGCPRLLETNPGLASEQRR